jgi:predicted metalloendopeptidase
LQPPNYDPAASEAMNYGGIGAIIGHEVSHFVDTRLYLAPQDRVRIW